MMVVGGRHGSRDEKEHETMHAEVNVIRSKMAADPWPKYLDSITIDGIHGWADKLVRFPFPVTVIAGENGSGKSTVLKAAALAYKNNLPQSKSFHPSSLFPDTPWETIRGATLIYSITEGVGRQRRYGIRKPTERWRMPERSERAVIWQDVSRTLPIDTTVGYSKLAKRTAMEVSAVSLTENYQRYYSTILGRSYSYAGFSRTDIDNRRSVGVVSCGGQRYSQFHQGAGEDATLDLILLLQNIPDTSLILIDEIEASLHPRSQRRLMHFLLWLARTKQIQVIVSTHSAYVIDEVPEDGRIFLARGSAGVELLASVTSNYALNRMDDIDRPDLYVFCEDVMSIGLIREILVAGGIDLSRVKIMDVGPANILKALGSAAAEGRLPVRAVCVLDADQAESGRCIKTPGNRAPEDQVVSDLKSRGWESLGQRLGIESNAVKDALEQATASVDHHEFVPKAASVLSQKYVDIIFGSFQVSNPL